MINLDLILKTALGINFEPWKVPQPEDLHFHFHVFYGSGTSGGPKLNPKAVFKLTPI